MTKISVIMPAYNAVQYISESIQSVIDQSYKNWELIIVDDGSIDDTAKIVKDFANRESRIKYFYQKNSRQGKARNLALKHADGDYIAFLDADDLWHPLKLEKQIFFLKSKNADLVFCDSSIFNEDPMKPIGKLGVKAGYFFGNEGIKLFLESNRIPLLTVLVKREKVLQVNGFTEVLEIQNAEDYHLWLKLLSNNNKFYASDELLAYYRKHSYQSTANDSYSTFQAIHAIQSLSYNNNDIKHHKTACLRKWYKKFYQLEILSSREFHLNIMHNYKVGTNLKLRSYIMSLSIRMLSFRYYNKIIMFLI